MEINNSSAQKLCTDRSEHNLCNTMQDFTQHRIDLSAAERDQRRSSHAAPRESRGDLAFTVRPMVSSNAAQVGVQVAW